MKQVESLRSRLGSASGQELCFGWRGPLVRMQKPSLSEVGNLSQL